MALAMEPRTLHTPTEPCPQPWPPIFPAAAEV
jgi:hypothetical protein